LTAVVLDAGALVAVDRGDRALRAQIHAAQERGLQLRTPAIVVAQAWRDATGRQARLSQLLRAVEVVPVDLALARDAGVLLGRTGLSDAVDATVAVLAQDGDQILTSDPNDLRRLTAAANRAVTIVPC